MGILSKIITFPVMGPLSGLVFIAKTIQDQIDAQEKEMSPQARLLELESLLLLGEITDEEYQEREEAILSDLDAQLAEEADKNSESKDAGLNGSGSASGDGD
jgi:hypothetical protein